jgi:hypothetical protein
LAPDDICGTDTDRFPQSLAAYDWQGYAELIWLLPIQLRHALDMHHTIDKNPTCQS